MMFDNIEVKDNIVQQKLEHDLLPAGKRYYSKIQEWMQG